jgi:hypothetical protein
MTDAVRNPVTRSMNSMWNIHKLTEQTRVDGVHHKHIYYPIRPAQHNEQSRQQGGVHGNHSAKPVLDLFNR